jgi:hypothetical protein
MMAVNFISEDYVGRKRVLFLLLEQEQKSTYILLHKHQ